MIHCSPQVYCFVENANNEHDTATVQSCEPFLSICLRLSEMEQSAAEGAPVNDRRDSEARNVG